MNDSTYNNASDPNSMKDQGNSRNAVYNVMMDGHPAIHSSSYSKALISPQKLNKGFYSFGAQHTNIRSKLNTPGQTAEGRKKLAHLLDRKFQDIKQLTDAIDSEYVDKAPNAVMNDYTKNISQTIFTPGIIRESESLKRNERKFVNTEYRTKHLKQRPK